MIRQLIYQDQQRKMRQVQSMDTQERRKVMKLIRTKDSHNYVFNNGLTVVEYCCLYTIDRTDKRRRY